MENETPSMVTKQSIFNEDVQFSYKDFYDLPNNTAYERFLVGNVKIQSGKVVCTDPLYRVLPHPQNWTVKNGDYPVYLYIGLDDYFAGRVAYAEICFKEEIPFKWEFSLISEDMLEDDFEKKMNGVYPVENGLSCFSDLETFKAYEQEIVQFYSQNKNGNFYLDVLAPHFETDAPKSSRGKDWANYVVASANSNIIMFGSGWGDGLYPRYVGFDNEGQVVKMITDFIQVEQEE